MEIPHQPQGALPPLQASEYLAIPAPTLAIDQAALEDFLFENRAASRSDRHVDHGQEILQGYDRSLAAR